MRKRKPAGWRTDSLSGSVVCPHRDLSVCRDCAADYADNVVNVFGKDYWAVDAADLADLRKLADR